MVSVNTGINPLGVSFSQCKMTKPFQAALEIHVSSESLLTSTKCMMFDPFLKGMHKAIEKHFQTSPATFYTHFFLQ